MRPLALAVLAANAVERVSRLRQLAAAGLEFGRTGRTGREAKFSNVSDPFYDTAGAEPRAPRATRHYNEADSPARGRSYGGASIPGGDCVKPHAVSTVLRRAAPFGRPRNSMHGDEVIRWTIRLALGCYVAYLAGWLAVAGRGRVAPGWIHLARGLWTAGCVLFVLHVLSAFHFAHHWSPASAFEKAAVETEALLGFRFGAGIYFSYLFLLVWVADVVWLWRQPLAIPPMPAASGADTPFRPAFTWSRLFVHSYLLFIAANGAIVFEAGPTRPAGIAAGVLLAGLAGWALWRQSAGAWRHAATPPPQCTADN